MLGVPDAELTNELRQVIHRAITKVSFTTLPKAAKDFKTGLSNSAHPACSAWLLTQAGCGRHRKSDITAPDSGSA
jgi:hypothetical protein